IDAREVVEAGEARAGWEARRRIPLRDGPGVAAERHDLEDAVAVRPQGSGAGRVDVLASDAGLKERRPAGPKRDGDRLLEREEAGAAELHTRGQSGCLLPFSGEQRETPGTFHPDAFVVEVVDPLTGEVAVQHQAWLGVEGEPGEPCPGEARVAGPEDCGRARRGVAFADDEPERSRAIGPEALVVVLGDVAAAQE